MARKWTSFKGLMKQPQIVLAVLLRYSYGNIPISQLKKLPLDILQKIARSEHCTSQLRDQMEIMIAFKRAQSFQDYHLVYCKARYINHDVERLAYEKAVKLGKATIKKTNSLKELKEIASQAIAFNDELKELAERKIAILEK